jgi:hypothetical protein
MVVLDVGGTGVRAVGTDGIRYSVPYGEPICIGQGRARRTLGSALPDDTQYPRPLRHLSVA